jgi:murein L,D-transpeptidase YafK
LEGKEKDSAIDKMLSTGCHLWWKNATETDKNFVIEKRSDSIRKVWDIDGKSIMNKQLDTFIKNSKNYNEKIDVISDIGNRRMMEIFEIV